MARRIMEVVDPYQVRGFTTRMLTHVLGVETKVVERTSTDDDMLFDDRLIARLNEDLGADMIDFSECLGYMDKYLIFRDKNKFLVWRKGIIDEFNRTHSDRFPFEKVEDLYQAIVDLGIRAIISE